MKKLLFIIFFTVLVCSLLIAHPASKVNINYDKQNKQVDIKVTHMVGDETSHYIKNAKIYLNGKEIITQHAKSQVDKKMQHFLYKVIDVKKGDAIKVEVECNKQGTRTESINI